MGPSNWYWAVCGCHPLIWLRPLTVWTMTSCFRNGAIDRTKQACIQYTKGSQLLLEFLKALYWDLYCFPYTWWLDYWMQRVVLICTLMILSYIIVIVCYRELSWWLQQEKDTTNYSQYSTAVYTPIKSNSRSYDFPSSSHADICPFLLFHYEIGYFSSYYSHCFTAKANSLITSSTLQE